MTEKSRLETQRSFINNLGGTKLEDDQEVLNAKIKILELIDEAEGNVSEMRKFKSFLDEFPCKIC